MTDSNIVSDIFAYVKPFLESEWRVNGAHLLLEFLSVEVTLVPMFNESQNVTCLSVLLHRLNAFLDAAILPFCLTHAHHSFLYVHELVWFQQIKRLPDHLPVTVHNPTYQS